MSTGCSFERNIGLLTKAEQNKLRKSAVAIAGIGGVGGLPAERLARLGVGRIKIADPEVFSNSDINRQFAASEKTRGRKKVEVVGKILREINSHLILDTYPDGINASNISDFLEGTDIVIDAIEFFNLRERMMLYPAAREKGIPVILSAATGFGSPLFVFSPDGMTMEEFFQVPSGKKEKEKFQIPLNKICPKIPEYVSAEIIQKVMNRKRPIPAISSTCALAGSILVMETLFLLLGKRKPVIVPECIVVDLYRQEIAKIN